MMRNRWSLVVVVLLLAGLLPLSSGGVAAGTHKVIVDRTDGATLAELQRAGAHLLVDYDSFSLWEVSDTTARSVAGRDTVAQRDDFDEIVLRTGTITTPGGVPTAPANLRQSVASGKQLWMVQFIGPVKPDWLDSLTKLGIEIVIYMPNNAYVLWLDGGQLKQLETTKNPAIQWTGAYEPAYRLAPALTARTGATMTPVTIQFYRTASTAASIASVQAFGGTVLRAPQDVLGFTDISLEVPAGQLVSIANRADVFNVEPYVTPKKLDEMQGQILANNLTAANGNVVPTGPGYLTWLNSLGFPTTPSSYPIVNITDDGIDNGTANPLHPDLHDLGLIGNPSRLIVNGNCTGDASGDGQAGHGNLNTGIVGAYNNRTGSPHVDASGYHLGLGISPYTRLSGTKIFNNAGNYDVAACSNTDAGVVANAYANGAAFTSDSWGADAAGAYDASAQAYDSLTRDASGTTAGNQGMLHIFAAGNAGPGASTVGSPGTAKNVLTVGATQNLRDNGVADGCGDTVETSADNIADFSSRGPATDGRVKPEIMAPGSHIQGIASQDPTYDGTGVCGGNPNPPNKYYPAGQTLYTWSSGTSHSTPAIAGATSLLYNYYGRVLNPGHTPSPAMLKALLLNRPRYLNGTGTGGSTPTNNQGWGDANLGDLFDTATPRVLVDQSTDFTTTGQTYVASGTVASGSKPFRVSLVWTDAPGSTTGAAYVNNLNLEVTIAGATYKGNVFSGAWSVAGGTADAKDNVENVFIPAGVGTHFTVKVTAANLAGVGVPGVVGNNQDFALVISNGTVGAGGASVGLQTPTISDAAPGGNNNGLIEAGETVTLTMPLKNEGDAAATTVSATLMTTDSTLAIVTGTSAYPDIAPGATQNNTTAFKVTLAAGQPCGVPVNLTMAISYNGGVKGTVPLALPTSFTLGTSVNYASTDIPKAIPDNTSAGVNSNLIVATTGPVGKVKVHLNATHTWDGDLVFTLIAPDNTSVTLASRPGGTNNSGDNFTNTVLDDAAATLISAGASPYTGTFRPDQPLSTLNGKSMTGTWKMNVSDNAAQDTGSLTGWSLDIQPANCTAAASLQITNVTPGYGLPAGGNTVTITGTGFTDATVTVDGTPVTPTSITPTQIVITMPPHLPAIVDIAVTTGGTVTKKYSYGTPNALPLPGAPGVPGGSPNPRPAPQPSGSTGGSPNPLPGPRP